MIRSLIPQRKRIFSAVEGEGEQSFQKFMQIQSDQIQLNVHLDVVVLNGGGYKTMLEKTLQQRSRKGRTKSPCMLVVDTDRADRNDDGWSIERLLIEASKADITVILQQPNFEATLLRMLPGNERLKPTATNAIKQLRQEWKDYKKPADARTLMLKYTLDDLRRAAKHDPHFKKMLEMIGLI